MRLKQAIDAFLFHCRYEKNLSSLTIKAYVLDLRQFTEFSQAIEQDICVASIDKSVLRNYLKLLYERYKTRSIKRKLATMKAFLNYLEFEDVIEANPFRKMRIKLKMEQELPKTVSLQTVEALLRSARQAVEAAPPGAPQWLRAARDLAAIELLFATGMRVGELCSLRVKDVDFDNSQVTVKGKGNKRRCIPVCSAGLMNRLREIIPTHTNGDTVGDCYLLTGSATPAPTNAVRQAVREHAPAPMTPHTLRHTMATSLLQNGVDIRSIQIILGHSSISVTEIYTHIALEHQRDQLQERHPLLGMEGG